MRIDEITSAYHSIIWFACDSAGHILLANSEEGAIPEFVASDRERTQQLAMQLCGIEAIDRNRALPIDYTALAARGFFCYRNDPFEGRLYHLYAKPQTPITVDALEDDLRQLLLAQRLPIDLTVCDSFFI